MKAPEFHRDVVSEGSAEGFETELLHRTVQTAKRARRNRVAVRATVVALLITVAVLQLWTGKKTEIVSNNHGTGVAASSPAPLRTEPFRGILRSEPLAAEMRIRSAAEGVAILKTGEADPGEVEAITDEQLLGLLRGHAVALLKRAPGESEVIFLDRN